MRRLPAPGLPPWLARQLSVAPFERSLVDLGEHRLHLMETGPASGRPVLLLHGNPTWGFLWRKVAAALAAARAPLRLYVPDLLGLGLSDRPQGAGVHTIERHAALIGQLVDGLRPSSYGRPIFVGQDWGGPIGVHAFADRPGLLGGMVILNTALSPPREGFKPTAFHRFARLPLVSDAAFRLLGFPQRVLFTAQGDRASIRGPVARAYVWPLRDPRTNGAPLALARMVPNGFDHPSIPALRRCQEFVQGFAGPSAIVWGDRDPVLGRLRGWIETLLPKARVTRTQAGHFLQEEVPDEIAGAISYVHSVHSGA